MIAINHVSHRYTNAPNNALTDVCLTINDGAALGLLGPNGAGKTTLMSLLAGLQTVQQGEIIFHGTSSQQLNLSQRRQISLVPQDFAFYPLLSVWDNLCYFAALYEVKDKAWLNQLLDKTDLQAHKNKIAKNLSGGLKRRLNFAIGLVNRPKLIFLDEITVGIDPESRQFILDNVAQLNRNGVTIIYTSHYLQEIEQLCSHIALLSQGQLIHQGKVNDVLTQNNIQQNIIRTIPPLSPEHLTMLSGSLKTDGSVILSEIDFNQLHHFLNQHGYALTTCQFGQPSLETFYLDFLRQHPC